jgi:serine/threonine protein kinase
MDGGSLESLIASHKTMAQASRLHILGLPELVIAQILLQVLVALEFLHSRGVVHRDMKPANILLEKSGSVKLSDFGISKQLEENFASAKSFVGTATYMAPERLQGNSYGTHSDVWSLGIIAMECANGEHPLVHAASYYDLIVELSDGRRTPRLSTDMFSANLCSFVAMTLATTPEDRGDCRSLLEHAYIAKSSGLIGTSIQPTIEQLLELATHRLREWREQSFCEGDLAGMQIS